MQEIMHLIKQRTETVKPLADMGARLISELTAQIKTEFVDDFIVVKAENTSLLISYFGYQVIIRVEIELKLNGESWIASARLVAYSVDRNTPPKETEVIAYEFDKLGNVTRKVKVGQDKFLPNKFAAWFLLDLFTAAAEKGMGLRPN
jgi:hypothetical protein